MIVTEVSGAPEGGKGWFVGPWNSRVPVAAGWADRGVDEPHRHAEMHEIYLVARGESTAVVAGQPIRLRAGAMLVVEPGEVHMFTDSSTDYPHFVVQAPFVRGDKWSVAPAADRQADPEPDHRQPTGAADQRQPPR